MATRAPDDLRITDEFDFEIFWEKHGKQITGAVIVIAVLGLILLYWQHQTTSRAEEAENSLAHATDSAALQAVARNYPKSPAAPEALARLADLFYRNGRYPEAAGTYEMLMRDYPNHPLGLSSKLGLAAALEGQGNFEGAKTQYQQIISTEPGSYVADAAKMGLARCLEIQGQKKEALQLYEELLAGGQNSPWFEQAYLRMVVLNRDMPPQKTEQPVPTPLSGTPGATLVPSAESPGSYTGRLQSSQVPGAP
jgi:tetratricopeptide (TPR) repeat protein